jgi:hypothetical protein
MQDRDDGCAWWPPLRPRAEKRGALGPRTCWPAHFDPPAGEVAAQPRTLT